MDIRVDDMNNGWIDLWTFLYLFCPNFLFLMMILGVTHSIFHNMSNYSIFSLR